MGWFKNCAKSEIDWLYNNFVSRGWLEYSVGLAHQSARRDLVETCIEKFKGQNVASYPALEYELRSLMAKDSLRDDDLNWLDEKDRLQCLFVWSAVYNLRFWGADQFLVLNAGDEGYPQQFNYLTAPHLQSAFSQLMPINYEDKSSKMVAYTKDFFQRLPGARGCKVQVLRSVRDHYQYLLKHGSPVHFIADTDVETRSWAWAYLSSKGVPTRHLKASEYDIEPEHLLVAYELWDASKAEKELILHRLKAAYSQRKTRMKRHHRKAYQIYLTAERKEMLNELSWHYDKKIYEVVERLISEAYRNIKK